MSTRSVRGRVCLAVACMLWCAVGSAQVSPETEEIQKDVADTDTGAESGLEDGGGEHPKNEPCGQNGTNAKDYDNGAPPAPDSRTDHPVLIASGHKYESVVDLVVALPNRDFVLEREYSSQQGLSLPRTSGPGWFFPCMSYIQTRLVGAIDPTGGVVYPDRLQITLIGSASQQLVFYPASPASGRPRWKATGATAQFWERSVIRRTAPSAHAEPPEDPPPPPVNRAVLTFYSQGEWERHYYRPYTGTQFYPPALWPLAEAPVTLDEGNGWLSGYLAEERDPYGNRWEYTYELRYIHPVLGAGERPRVRMIRCYSRRGEGEALDAQIEFHWISSEIGGSTHPNQDRLRAVTVHRLGASSPNELVEVQRAVYYYFQDFGPVISPDVGSAGDLVQVATYERVDAGPAQGLDPIVPTEVTPVTYPARVRITQHRYHNGVGECVSPPVTQGCLACISPEEEAGFFDPTGAPQSPFSPRLGAAHQLKQTIEPEQVEWYAQRRNEAAPPSGSLGLVAAAAELASKSAINTLSVDDAGVEVRVHHLAAKTITYYCSEATVAAHLRGRVRTQGLRTTMPGSASQGPGRLLKYAYYTYPEPAAPETAGSYAQPATNSGYVQTTRITEALRIAGGSYVDYRLRAYDTIMFKSRWVDAANPNQDHIVTRRFTANDATVELPTMARKWVTHYEYDPSPRSQSLMRMMTPSATAHYALGTNSPGSPAAAPVYTPSADTGLVYGYAYNADQRRTEIRVRQGAGVGAGPGGTAALDGPGGYSIVERSTYYEDHPGSGPPSIEPLWRSHLLQRVERFSVEGITEPSGSEGADRETTSFDYGFYANREDNLKPLAGVAWVRHRVERETIAELGPGAAHVDSFETFDEAGNPAWSIASNGALTQRETLTPSPGATGRVRSITLNAPSPLPGGGPIIPEETYFFHTNELDQAFVTALSEAGITPGLADDGGSLTTAYHRDLLGRIVEAVAPGAVSTYTTREMRPLDHRPGLEYYAEALLPMGSGPSFNGAASIEWRSGADQSIQTSRYAFPSDSPGVSINAAGAGYIPHVASYDRDRLIEISREAVNHAATGLPREQRRWHDVDADRFYRTLFQHDAAGRLTTIARDSGAIDRVEHDVRDRVTRRMHGVTDFGAPDPFGAAVNEKEIAQLEYDGDAALPPRVGNGALTRITDRVSDTESRITTIVRDYRDRAVQIRRPVAPHDVMHYDNLRRTTGRDVYTQLPADPASAPDPSHRAHRATRSYSQRGLVWRERVAIDPVFVNPSDPLDPGPSLETLTWRDAPGRPIARWGADQPGVKTIYDGLDRVRTERLSDRGNDAAPGQASAHADAASLDGDIVYEESHHDYAPDGVETLTTTIVRAHDLQATGELTGASSAGGVIASYIGTFYDAFNRPTRIVDYGTNTTGFRPGGAAPFDPAAPPSPPAPGASGAQRVWEIAYNSRGLTDSTVDPLGRRARTLYDDLDRPIAEVENAIAFSEASLSWLESGARWRVNGLAGPTDQDRVASVVYNSDGRVTKIIAHIPQQGDDAVRVTEYLWNTNPSFGAGEEHSQIASVDLLAEVRYPDEATGLPGVGDAHRVRLAYNRRGELRHYTDQNGLKRRITRDALGRITQDEAHLIPAHIDNRVTALSIDYDAAGRMAEARSLHGAVVLNAMRFGYDRGAPSANPNPMWDPLDIWQERFGAVSAATPRFSTRLDVMAPALAPSNPADAGNRSRTFSQIYPLHAAPNPLDDADTVRFDYTHPDAWVSGGRIGRAHALRMRQGDNTYAEVARYAWIGLDTPATVRMPRPRVLLDHQVTLEGGSPAQGSRQFGVYPGYDAFGRIVRQAWIDDELGAHPTNPFVPSVPPIVQDRHTFDNSSNYVATVDARPGARAAHRERRNTHDELDRLAQSLLGAPSSGSGGSGSFLLSAIAYQASESWTLDALGNWSSHARDANGNGAWTDPDEREERAHNGASELVERIVRRLPASPDQSLSLTFDDAGALREESTPAPAPGSPGTTRYTHDAWGRLVRVEAYIATTDGWLTLVEHEHNALGWRIGTRADTSIPPDGAPDQDRAFFYDADWRLVEERIDDDVAAGPGDGPDRVAQHVWGPIEERGLDDAILRREGTFAAGAAGSPGTPTAPGVAPTPGAFTGWGAEREVYYLTDLRGSPVALVRPGPTPSMRAVLVERVSWSPYGAARHRPLGDIDGDGLVGFQDLNIVLTLIEASDQSLGQLNPPSGTGSYNADADFDRDGDIDFADLNSALLAFGRVEPPGAVSGAAVGSPIGYCGSLFEPVSQLHHNRYRDYSASLGRWLRRDPIGYADGLNLYEYVMSAPLTWTDPMGLAHWTEYIPDWIDPAANWSAGMADVISFGITDAIRESIGVNDVVDKSSTAYKVGEVTGVGLTIATGAAAGIRVAAARASRAQIPGSGLEFSHGWIPVRHLPARLKSSKSPWLGTYVKTKRHAKHDYWRRPKDSKVKDKWWLWIRFLDRTPKPIQGIGGGALWGLTPLLWRDHGGGGMRSTECL